MLLQIELRAPAWSYIPKSVAELPTLGSNLQSSWVSLPEYRFAMKVGANVFGKILNSERGKAANNYPTLSL